MFEPGPKLIAVFDRLFEETGITSPDDRAAIVREIFTSEMLQERLTALATKLIAEAGTMPPKEP